MHKYTNTVHITVDSKLTANESPQYKETSRRFKHPIERNLQNIPQYLT